MKNEIYGNKKVIDGMTYYSQSECSDGMECGYVFKDYDAFNNRPNEVCYIPEHAFDDVKPIQIDGEDFYPAEELSCYTRNDLERLLLDDDGKPLYTDADEDSVSVEWFFDSLFWCYPETKMNELDY